ncbi:MAG: methionine synthase [Angustibacter sp.]
MPRGVATGVGSWPGTSVREALAVVRGELADLGHLPYLPELPDRGPGSDLIGRSAARLAGLPVDLQPSGWRLVDRPGRDQARADAVWRADLDQLAEVFDGWAGPFKVQLCGPWTLAASVQLPRGERAISDPGARRDLVQSSAQTAVEVLTDLTRALPRAEPVLQLDEPSLPAVLSGGLTTASGYGRLPAVPSQQVRDGLAAVVTAAHAAGVPVVLHSCAHGLPMDLIRDTGADAVNLDVGQLGARGWESLAASVEAGLALWAGAVPTEISPERAGGHISAAPAGADGLGSTAGGQGDADQQRRAAEQWADQCAGAWRRVGLPAQGLADVVVTPACGLAGWSPSAARTVLASTARVARLMRQRADQ